MLKPQFFNQPLSTHVHMAECKNTKPSCMFHRWGSFPGTLAKKYLFNSWMLIGFSEDVSLKNDDCFLKTTLKPTTCFFKECQKCFLLKMPMHAVHAALKNDPRKPFFREHKSPHFAVDVEGDSNGGIPTSIIWTSTQFVWYSYVWNELCALQRS